MTTTFSQAVDLVAQETRRPDLLPDIVTYMNQTLREVHLRPDNNQIVLLAQNMDEFTYVADQESNYGVSIGDVGRFQAVGTIRYPSVGEDCFPPEKTPGRGMIGQNRFYYRAGDMIYFSGYGGLNARIDTVIYRYPRRLKYYTSENRPAEHDEDLGWRYGRGWDVSDELKAGAIRMTTNWLLARWEDTLLEGVRAKVYKRLADTERARTCYSQYTAMRMGLISSESAKPGGYA